jgi:hypothetical protein
MRPTKAIPKARMVVRMADCPIADAPKEKPPAIAANGPGASTDNRLPND